MINNVKINVIPADSIHYTNELLDIFCQQINDNIITMNIISVSTKVYKQKFLVFTIQSNCFFHLKTLNQIDYQIKQFINEYDETIKSLFQNNIEGITLNIHNYNNELIFNEYYNI